MGSSLNGQQIKNTFPGLIKTSGSGQIPVSGFAPITDGIGNDSFLALSRQSVGIGANLFTVDASAVLEINSTTKGVLFPRLTTTQINAIATPTAGLTVYCTTVGALAFYDGTEWRKVSHTAL